MSSTLNDALGQVGNLSSVQFVHDDEPDISPAVLSIGTRACADTNLSDVVNQSADEETAQMARYLADISKHVKEGYDYANLLYAARSLSKAIPQVKSPDQPNRMQLYEETMKILQPLVDTMKKFMYFHKNVIDLLASTVTWLAQTFVGDKRDLFLIPENIVTSIAQLLDVLFTLDNLKNVKSAWNNDFSAYKRACSNLKKLDPNETMENQELYMFLASNSSILNGTKQRLLSIDNFKEIIAHTVNVSCDFFEGNKYVLPSERHMLLKVMVCGIFLMDGQDPKAKSEKDDKMSIHKVKRLKLDRLQRIMKRFPVIPLVGDMHFTPVTYLRQCPHIEVAKWNTETEEETAALASKFLVVEQLAGFKAEYETYTSELCLLRVAIAANNHPDDIIAVVLKGMKLMSLWTAAILEQTAWKFAHPVDKYTNRDLPEDAKNYEKAVRYNYSREERIALVELIAMIKDTQKLLRSMAGDLVAELKLTLHQTVQGIIHGVVQPLIQKSNLKKRKEAAKALATLYNLVGDLDITVDTHASSSIKQGQRNRKTAQLPEGVIILPARSVATTASQMFHMRSVLGSLINIQSEDGKGGLMKEKDLTPQQLQDLSEFFDSSRYFTYLLEFEDTVFKCGDLADLWFKEFYLELAKEVQFPIEMSLPWILTQTALQNPNMIEYIMYPLDLYNDSANRALHHLNSQYLYDEIEAEVNLCFDQLVFEVSELIFTRFKSVATSQMLDKVGKTELADFKGPKEQKKLDPIPGRFQGIIRQRHLNLLGRSVNMNMLITQSVNTLLRTTIDMIIGTFESEDITGVLSLEFMLDNTRLTHSMLSKYLAIDPFEHMLTERNVSMNPASHYGRIEHKIMYELLYDFMPNYCFNAECVEFTRTPLTFAEQIERENPPKTSANLLYGSKPLQQAALDLLEPSKEIFRVQHAASIVRLIGPQKLGTLVNELCQNVGLQMHTVMRPYMLELAAATPKVMKDPDFAYGTPGAFGYYQALLKPILQYPDLSTEVYQAFRVVGNTLCLINMIENALDIVDVLDYVLVDPFARIQAPARRVRLPTQEEIRASGKTLGFNIQGGQEHNRPVIISKVEPGSIAEDLGLAAGDEILDCNGQRFHFPQGEDGPRFILHSEAVKAIQGCAGHQMIVRSSERVTYLHTIDRELKEIERKFQSTFFKDRCARAGPLSNAISITGSVFRGALETINKLLDDTGLRELWCGPEPSNGVMHLDTTEFHRVWAAIHFSYCVPSGSSLTTHALFGEGLQWGGICIVYLLGQALRFQAMNYTSHVLKIHAVDKKDDQVGQIKMTDFIASAAHYDNVTERVLSTLRLHYKDVEESNPLTQARAHPPPNPEQDGWFELHPGQARSAPNGVSLGAATDSFV